MAQDNNPDIRKLVDDAMASAQASLEQAAGDVAAAGAGPRPAPETDGPEPQRQVANRIQLLSDVELRVTIELGRTEMLVEDVLRLGPGSVVELDKLAGDPVDVYVSQRLIARGEVLVLNDSFCVRISEIVEDLEGQAEAALQQQAEAV